MTEAEYNALVKELNESCKDEFSEEDIIRDLHMLSNLCRYRADKWYHDPVTGAKLKLNSGERFMLMVSEISEAMEAVRKDLHSDHLPEFLGVEEELADALIRIFDYCGEHKLRIGEAFVAKLAYNATRSDHTHEARMGAHGKKF